MSWPQRRICWLSIYLSLLALCIHATEVNKEETNSTLKPAENSGHENYEVIDVAQNNKNGNQQLQTGQTTRIFTTEDVNDDFWLKHLGEDFKYAIHLQVGDSDRYDGVYNMTEDGSNYDIQHDYRIKEIPVDGNESKTQQQTHQHRTEDTTQQKTLNTQNTSTEHISTTDDQRKQTFDDEKEENKNNDAEKKPAKPTSDDKDFEQLFALDHDDGISLMKKLQSMKKFTNEHIKTPKIQNINIKYTPKLKTDQQKDTKQEDDDKEAAGSSASWQSPASSASPIVVTLPHNEKTVHQLADENTPVVVKMPPVIYHHNPNFDQLTPQSHMNPATSQHLQQDPNMSQHNQFTLPTLTHSHQQQQHYENTDFSQYNALASSQTALNPPQQQQSYYTPSLLEDAATYRASPIFSAQQTGASINALPSQNSKEQLQKTHGSIRFILRKPSAPYNRPPAHNQLPLENSF